MWQRREHAPLVANIFSIEYVDDEVGPGLKGPQDIRVGSRLARFRRKQSLDEIPQLFNALLGQMLRVGPGPATRAGLDRIDGGDTPSILPAKPGTTGLWQVSGWNRLTLGEERRLDLECTEKKSLGFYFWILMRSFPEVIRRG